MTDLLHDPAIHRRLTQAVRTRCPEDWQASRRHRWARLWSKSGWFEKMWSFLGFLILGAMLALPFTLVENARMLSHEAAGLMGLHLVCASLIAGSAMVAAPSVRLSPLLNMPVMLAQMHLHVLSRLRQHVWCSVVVGLLIFASAFGVMILICDVDRAVLSRIPVAALLSFGPSLALAWCSRVVMKLAVPLPRSVLRCLALIPTMAFGILVWELAYTAFSFLPSPGIIGNALIVLPQAELCEWVLGAECPWRAVLLCLAATVISSWRLHELLRDSKPELDEDYLHHTPELTAEAVLAAALNERRHKEGWPQITLPSSATYVDHSWDDDDDFYSDTDEAPTPPIEVDGENGQRLFHHDTAPREHNVPVTPEFRAVMAADLQRLLEAPPETCLMQQVMALRGPPEPERAVIRKNAMILGVVPLILIELGLLVPHTWSEWLKTVPIIAAVFISGWHFIWHTIWSRLNENVWLYDAWPKLPFDGSTWISLYAVRFEWPWLRWRCQFGLIALSAWALTCGVIDCIKTALGWQAGQIHLEMLYQGPFSLPTMGLLMVSVTWGMRCLERFSFARRVAAVVKWRGIWKLWGMLSLAIQTLGAFSMVFGMIWAFLMIADDWNGWIGWLSLPLLLLAEGLHWFGSWLAVRVLRHGSGDV